MTGIARQSYLCMRPAAVHVDNLQVTADANGRLTVNADVTGSATLRYKLTDAKGATVAETTAEAKDGRCATEILVANPSLWSAETPYLYTLTTEVMAAQPAKARRANVKKNTEEVAEPVEVLTNRVGFRTVEIRDGQLLVNGKAVLFKGIVRHELDPDKGYVVSTERMISDIKRLKEFNFNAGAIFLGQYSPEPLGDYYAGPNHVLPTGGTAKFYSVLNVETFMKKTSIISYTAPALYAAADDIITLAEAEGLTAHANAIRKRIGK